ncbi:LysR family transcriptional regulator [Vibrio amylolyticus]|uniref:LysR family transcriptional regulator n=1 Tax=Vibrio amylolyticus TaxID=2847292 RepID=UPI00354E7D4D
MLDLVRVFEQVIESGSFSQAGKALHMAPSSVARNIDALEMQLETTLFKRSTRQLVLTEEGQYFYEKSSKLLYHSDQLIHEMRGNKVQPQGPLRISVFDSFGNLQLAPLIPKFLKLYPNVKIELDINNNLVDLNADNIDIAIRIGKPKDSQLKARKLLVNHTFVVATPEYLDTHAKIETPEDLQAHNCLSISHGRQRKHWYFQIDGNQSEKKRRETKSIKVAVNGNFDSKGGSPLLSAALADCGVILLSEWIVRPYLESNQLKRILSNWSATYYEHSSSEVYAVYKGDRYPNPNIRVFIDFLLEHLNATSDIVTRNT